jgi:hypothetical protein
VNKVQQFAERTDGPYTGSGSATLNVKAGFFEIKIGAFDDKVNGNYVRYRNKLGIAEKALVILFPENEDDLVEFSRIDKGTNKNRKNRNLLFGGNLTIDAGNYSGSTVVKVWAKVNGEEEGPESISVTVVEPSSVRIEKIEGSKIHVNGQASVGFWGITYIYPGNVSFKNINRSWEGYVPGKDAEVGGYFEYLSDESKEHKKGQINHFLYYPQKVAERNRLNVEDQIGSGVHTKQPYKSGFYRTHIPRYFLCGDNQPNANDPQDGIVTKVTHEHTIDENGKMNISKGEVMKRLI